MPIQSSLLSALLLSLFLNGCSGESSPNSLLSDFINNLLTPTENLSSDPNNNSNSPNTPLIPEPDSELSPPTSPREAYNRYCIQCHGSNGLGIETLGPAVGANVCQKTNCSNLSELTAYNQAQMPPDNPNVCIGQCANLAAQHIITEFDSIFPATQGPASCNSLLPGNFDCTLGQRDYITYVPTSYNGILPVPLVIDMHGFTNTNVTQQAQAGWDNLAEEKGFIVVYPQGIGNAWNAQGACCGLINSQDEQFIINLIATLQNSARIDENRIYATGFSNGGSMAHTLACNRADLFKAIASISFSLSGGASNEIIANCTPSKPISVIHFHGTEDEVANYNDGILDSLGAQESLSTWVQIQNCSNNSTTETITNGTQCRTHTCPGNTAVSLCTVEAGRHSLYPHVSDKGIAGFVWDFFEENL